jgi:hypothetical protein
VKPEQVNGEPAEAAMAEAATPRTMAQASVAEAPVTMSQATVAEASLTLTMAEATVAMAQAVDAMARAVVAEAAPMMAAAALPRPARDGHRQLTPRSRPPRDRALRQPLLSGPRSSPFHIR